MTLNMHDLEVTNLSVFRQIVGCGRIKLILFVKNVSNVQGIGDWVVVKSGRFTQQAVKEHLEGTKRAVICGGERFCRDTSSWLQRELLMCIDSDIEIMASTTK